MSSKNPQQTRNRRELLHPLKRTYKPPAAPLCFRLGTAFPTRPRRCRLSGCSCLALAAHSDWKTFLGSFRSGHAPQSSSGAPFWCDLVCPAFTQAEPGTPARVPTRLSVPISVALLCLCPQVPHIYKLLMATGQSLLPGAGSAFSKSVLI